MTSRTPAARIASQGPDDFAAYWREHAQNWMELFVCDLCDSVSRVPTDRGMCRRCRKRQDCVERALVVAIAGLLIVGAALFGKWWGA